MLDMTKYTKIIDKDSQTKLFCCNFGCGTCATFQIDIDDIDPDFTTYTARVLYESLGCIQFPLPLWDRETLEEKRQETIYYDFDADTLEDMIFLLTEAYRQYLIVLEAI
jgi:hypothetical protein